MTDDRIFGRGNGDVLVRFDEDKSPLAWQFLFGMHMAGVVADPSVKRSSLSVDQLFTSLTAAYLLAKLEHSPSPMRLRLRIRSEDQIVDEDFDVSNAAPILARLTDNCGKGALNNEG